jgi:uncharacterized protein (DUF1800 family)
MHDRVDRRKVLATVAGTGLAVAAASHFPGNTGTADWLPSGDRARTARRSAAGEHSFANADDSYAQASGKLISATKAPPPQTLLFETAADAAAATKVAVPTILATGDPVVHLLRRTSAAPTRALVAAVHAQGIDAWLAGQLHPATLPDPVADAAWAAFPLAAADAPTIRGRIVRGSWDAMTDYGRASLARQVWSNRQLYEVMVDFWANHLNIPLPGPGGWDVGPAYHREVIRAHALGSFSDMLVASARHPAMLRYLNGNDSSKQSVNENYGRELLELHTVGIDGGYTETDVRNSAYILTGRTVVLEQGPGVEGAFVYDPGRHWTGRVQVLGFAHDNAGAAGGLDVGDAYVRYLARHPATARSIARKLAVRFVSDLPPPTLVDRLAKAYLDSDTAIVPVLEILFRSGEFWAAVGQKVRRPLENVIASARVLGIRPGPNNWQGVDYLYRWAIDMGQRPFGWPSPNGYPDVHAAWRSAGVVVDTWNVHRHLLDGWIRGVTATPPVQVAADMPRRSVGEYVDSLCQTLCLQTFRPAHRDALIGFTGSRAGAPPDPESQAVDLVSLVLDSPYFLLR